MQPVHVAIDIIDNGPQCITGLDGIGRQWAQEQIDRTHIFDSRIGFGQFNQRSPLNI